MSDQATKLRELVAREHHPFGPSIIGLRAKCPGSFPLWKKLGCPRAPESDDAQEGTLCHERTVSGDLTGLTPLQAEMVQACRARWLPLEQAGWQIEHEGKWAFSDDLCSGHIDTVATRNGRAKAWDYKFTHMPLDEDDIAYQASSYSGMILEAGAHTVDFEVYAPRTGEVYSRTFTQKDLPAIRQSIEDVILSTKDPEAPLRTNNKCHLCDCFARCPAVALEVDQMSWDQFSIEQDLATPELRGNLYEIACRAEKWGAAQKAALKELLLKGEKVDGLEVTTNQETGATRLKPIKRNKRKDQR